MTDFRQFEITDCMDQDSELTSFAKLTTGAAFFMRSLRSKKWLERIETAAVIFPTARRFQRGMVEQQSPPFWRAVGCARVPGYPTSRAIVHTIAPDIR